MFPALLCAPMVDPLPNFASRLAHARALGELSCRELDELAGLGKGHVAILEGKGADANPTIATVFALAKVLGVQMDWLLTGRGKQPVGRLVRLAIYHAVKRNAEAKASHD
jgi:transcriptional regulator with XRE-family HTH domain